MYLLDTVVLSELQKKDPSRHVIAWIRAAAPDDLFLSSLTIGEVELGIERQRSIDPSFAGRLEAWLETTLRAYGDRVLPLNVPIARQWGRLAARIGHKGLDLALAATAIEHRLAVVTRNVAHFTPTGVATINPFEAGSAT